MTPAHKAQKMQFEFLRTLSKNDIPKPTSGGRKSVVKELPFWPELTNTLGLIQRNGIAPFEAVELDMKLFEKETAKLKKPLLAILQSIRAELKEMKLETKIEVIRRGDRIFLMGASNRA